MKYAATGPEGLTELQDKGSKVYVYGICMVAAFGGLLFGYDTAVISGTVCFIALVVPETKGRTLEDIERMWLRAG